MLEDDDVCTTCQGNHVHMCNSTGLLEKTYGVFTCPYCGEENVNERHLCKGKLEKITHVCKNCGRISDDTSKLCHPVLLEEAQKAEWMEIAHRENIKTCKNCDQPVTSPGHVCDPILPYVCDYCGTKVENSNHLCKEKKEKSQYFCKLCGRLAVDAKDVCSPIKLQNK